MIQVLMRYYFIRLGSNYNSDLVLYIMQVDIEL